jgi:hypothetical protein
MVTCEIRDKFQERSGSYFDFEKTRVKFISNFSRRHVITYSNLVQCNDLVC